MTEPGFTAPGARTPSDTIAEEFVDDVAEGRSRPDPAPAPAVRPPAAPERSALPALAALTGLAAGSFLLGRLSVRR